jgi:hypothetical protein
MANLPKLVQISLETAREHRNAKYVKHITAELAKSENYKFYTCGDQLLLNIFPKAIDTVADPELNEAYSLLDFEEIVQLPSE